MKNMSAEWQGRLKHWLYALRQEAVKQPHLVERVTDERREQLFPRDGEKLAIVFP